MQKDAQVKTRDESDDEFVQAWSTSELMRWYRRGKKKMERMMRVEVLMSKLMNLDIYVNEMMDVNLNEITRIQKHHIKTVRMDTDNTTSEEERQNRRDKSRAEEDCEHVVCHKVNCQF